MVNQSSSYANRGWQALLVGGTLGLSWLAMQAVHEGGHVLHAWCSGGRVVRVVLHPAAFSRTDVTPNPRPVFERWGGPLWGCAIPLALWPAVRILARPWAYLPQFFAGFCLIANGGYLAGGSFSESGDAGDLLRLGVPQWQLLAFGLVTVPSGLRLWHGLGPNFGLGGARGKVDRRAAIVVAALLALLVALELAWS